MFKKLTVIFFACALAGFLGCDLIKQRPVKKNTAGDSSAYSIKGPVVAKVNNLPISLDDLSQEIDAYNAMVPKERPEAKVTTPQQKIDYLKSELVRRILLYQEALDRGFDRKEEIARILEKTKQDLLVVELVKQEAEKVEVTSAEVEEYYNTYKDQLKEPEERQVREIVVATEQEAKDVMIQLLQGADFATLAKERSIAPTKAQAGDLGFIRPGMKNSAAFDNEAFGPGLDVNKTSNIFKGPDGFYIIKLEAKRGGKAKSLSELWEDIKKGLTFLKQQKKIDDLVNSLQSQAKIEIFESEVK